MYKHLADFSTVSYGNAEFGRRRGSPNKKGKKPVIKYGDVTTLGAGALGAGAGYAFNSPLTQLTRRAGNTAKDLLSEARKAGADKNSSEYKTFKNQMDARVPELARKQFDEARNAPIGSKPRAGLQQLKNIQLRRTGYGTLIGIGAGAATGFGIKRYMDRKKRK